jgi:hypothetical protein
LATVKVTHSHLDGVFDATGEQRIKIFAFREGGLLQAEHSAKAGST